LKEAIEEPEAYRKVGDGIVVELNPRSVKYGQVLEGYTHIEDDEEEQIDTVEKNKHPEQPPVSLTGEKKSEAATRMIEQEAEFFPDAAAARHAFGAEPDDEAKHARKTCVADDD
jgi:hypothetical protein